MLFLGYVSNCDGPRRTWLGQGEEPRVLALRDVARRGAQDQARAAVRSRPAARGLDEASPGPLNVALPPLGALAACWRAGRPPSSKGRDRSPYKLAVSGDNGVDEAQRLRRVEAVRVPDA